MLRYIFVLLLVNASYRSLGNPIPPGPPVPVSLANSLTILAGRCENVFIKNLIMSKIVFCSDLSSPHGEKQLQCLIFYDINKQLCDAVGTAALELPEADYTPKINEELDVNSLCLSAQDWTFSNLTEFLRYKQTVDKIFKQPSRCGKICGVEDLFSDEANFVCKYFNWGSELLKSQATKPSTQINSIKTQVPAEAENVQNNPEVPISISNDLQDLQIKNTTESKVKTSTNNVLIKNEGAAKIALAKPETSSLGVIQNNQSTGSASSNIVSNPEKPDIAINNDNIEDTGAMPESSLKAVNEPSKSPEDAPKVDPIQDSAAKLLEAPEHVESKLDDVKPDVDKDIQSLNTELEHKEAVLENPKVKQPGDVEDYQDSDEGKEGLSDIQGGDDGDDPMLADLDTKPEDEKPVDKKSETVVSTFNEREYYANPVQDAFPEEEDHFFPFFLTAVILVVLLYVLYHNKSKVGKVFFGLVLEGRQAGRRRNSRGHSYRRLDTLEQAMNANTAAPPSKIIY